MLIVFYKRLSTAAAHCIRVSISLHALMTFMIVESVLEKLVSKYRTKFRGNEIVCKTQSSRSKRSGELGVLSATGVARSFNGDSGEI